MTSPEQKNAVVIPDSLIKILGPRTNEHFKLELEYGVHIHFPQDTLAAIAGSAMDVILASSKLETLITQYSSVSQTKAPQPKSSQQKNNRPLEDFALKLGYEQEQINMVFDKLGPTIDKNTFLKELINVSGAKSRGIDDRWLPVSPRPRPVPKPMLSSTSSHLSGLNSQMYGPEWDSGVVARGVIPRPSAKNTTSNGSPIQGFANRDFVSTGNGISPHLYNGNLGMVALHTDSVMHRGYVPRTTAPATQGSNSAAVARGYLPRTTAQTAQNNNNTYSSNEWPERVPNGTYLVSGNDYNTVNSDPQQVDQMVDLLLTKKCQQLPQSDLRHIVIDGSNVAMR